MPKWRARWVFGEWKWLSDWYIIQKRCWRAISGFMGPNSEWMRTPQVLTEGWYILMSWYHNLGQDSLHSQFFLIFMFGHVVTLFQLNSFSISFWFDSDWSSICPGWGLLICLHCYLQLSIRILRTIPKVAFLPIAIIAQYSCWDRLLTTRGLYDLM